jgi:hypothetical protein
MKELETFLASSQATTLVEPSPVFAEATWKKVAQVYQRQHQPKWRNLFSQRWVFGLPVLVAFSLVVFVGIKHFAPTPTSKPSNDNSLTFSHDDSLESLNKDLDHLEAGIVNDPVIDDALNN